MSEYAEWIAALERGGRQRNGQHWQCPAHDDRTPSLHVTQGDNGRVLVKCFGAGCDFEAIRNALGIAAKRPEGAIVGATPARRTDTPRKPQAPSELPTGEGVSQWRYTDADGQVLFAVVRRDTPKGKRITQWTPQGDGWIAAGYSGQRPIYDVARITASTGRVAIVEGEKCVDAMRAAWPAQNVTTWAGGAKAWGRTDWTPLAGRAVSLIADADEPGRTAMRAIAEILAKLGCAVRLALPDGEDGADVADWLSDVGKDEAAQRVQTLLTDYVGAGVPHQTAKPLHSTDPPPPPVDEVDETKIEDNPHFAILGLDAARIGIRLKRAGQIVWRTREQMVQQSTLIGLAPETWWCATTGAPELSAKVSRRVGDSIIRLADSRGQVDQSRIHGLGAVRLPDGLVATHLGDRVYAEGRVVDMDAIPDAHWISAPPIALTDDAPDRHVRELAEALLAYRWATRMDGQRILGWIAASVAGGALQWRPHISFVAQASTGKTWIIERIARLITPLALTVSDVSVAGLSRLMEHSSRPIIIDEAEPTNAGVLGLFALLRVASGGFGMRVRAQQGGDGITVQEARFSALMSSTVAPRLSAADQSRVTPVRLGGPVADWPAVMAAIDTMVADLAPSILSRMIRRTAAIVEEADSVAMDLQEQGHDSRFALASASLTAGYRFWGLQDDVVVTAQDIQEREAATVTAADLLADILSLRYRRGGDEITVLGLARKDDWQAAEMYGLRVTDGDILIAPRHRGLIAALARTPHANIDIRSLLLQLDGAVYTDNPLRFGPYRQRAVLIPAGALTALGFSTEVEVE